MITTYSNQRLPIPPQHHRAYVVRLGRVYAAFLKGCETKLFWLPFIGFKGTLCNIFTSCQNQLPPYGLYIICAENNFAIAMWR